jgi:polar amino acid transport system permease protein
VFIFIVAFVFTRDIAELIDLPTRQIRAAWRGSAALALFYAAFIAEVIRAGVQSVSHGQREAGRAVGLKNRQVLRFIILPQAIRNTLPALGNDLIALMKDTALLSILAVRELTQLAGIYVGASFRVREGYFVLTIFYIVLTLLLSLLLRWYERRIQIPGQIR